MSRKLMATAFLVMGTFFAVSVFGGDLTTLVQKIPAMLVINDDAHAVPVRDLDDPGRSAAVFYDTALFRSDSQNGSIGFTVPEGKRLAIESVSFRVTTTDDVTVLLAEVDTRVNGLPHIQYLTPTLQNLLGDLVFVGGGPQALYADGGTEVRLIFFRDSNTTIWLGNASVAGHLIDCESCK